MKTCVTCGTAREDLNRRHICADCTEQGLIGEHAANPVILERLTASRLLFEDWRPKP